MNVPGCAMPVLSMFRPTFSVSTYHRFLVLVLATIMTTGRRARGGGGVGSATGLTSTRTAGTTARAGGRQGASHGDL
jgi:hypothetical protein